MAEYVTGRSDAESWGAERERTTVPPAREGSYEDAFHRVARENESLEDAILPLRDAPGALESPRGNRAIDVDYDPSSEGGNYVPTALSNRYDEFTPLEETEALHSLSVDADEERPPETYPRNV